MLIVNDLKTLQEQCATWAKEGQRVSLVPTMGYFHQGHEQLMHKGKEAGAKLVVSLFVNPSQFGPKEDLGTYPRDFERDSAIAEGNKVDILFAPTPEAMYPSGFDTWVQVPGLANKLCGKSRPGHFQGVCTVVLKLLNLVQPSFAFFGEKDWQQLAIIRRMVADLNLSTRIEGVPIVREADGLALSSRNTYLSEKERAEAPYLYKGLALARQIFNGGETNSAALRQHVLDYWKEHLPHGKPDYLQLVDGENLTEVNTATNGTRVITAVHLGKTRLIDNIGLKA